MLRLPSNVRLFNKDESQLIYGVFYLIRKFLPISDMQSMASLGRTLVFLDLETTGLDTWQCDIIQLAAISGVHSFNIYMMPQVAIDRGATAVNGFSVSDGALLLRGTAMPTATLTEALTSFLDFLRSLEQPVLLAAHNARRFDKPVLDRALLGCSLARQFQQLGSRFLDTLPLSRALHPGLDSHSLVNLSGYFLPRHYNAHDALEDVRALQELYNCWNPRQGTLDQFVF
ncbi:uncharacterized protein LOC115550703 [Gadus morhua]|uniref:exodeoxyribonuclease III n=1 Tax=Gadus morhua TaxID=8049 RepID=A0A8C4ZU88_GADMO|nr:uncharacterized protein LOC115550703 [Gadus morhua]